MSGAPAMLHASVIAFHRGGQWRGVLLQGPSGVGKSDLAIRAMARGWRLVSDDRTLVWRAGGRAFARGAERLYGLIEARHLDVVPASPLAFAELVMVVACEPDTTALERIPEPASTVVAGVVLPLIRMRVLEASALAKAERALAQLGSGFDTAPNGRI